MGLGTKPPAMLEGMSASTWIKKGSGVLLVEKAGVAPVVTFRITARKQQRVLARYPL